MPDSNVVTELAAGGAQVGIYRWYCGGQDEIAGYPVVRVTGSGACDEAIILCSECRRLAPFQNGCRYVIDE